MTRLRLATDLLNLKPGDSVARGLLQRVIIGSKKTESIHWSGRRFEIYNSPQQGINWMGQLPNVRAVLIKNTHGEYSEDRWLNGEKTRFRYSLKIRKGIVTLETANKVLIDQPNRGYPILLFEAPKKADWTYRGEFGVVSFSETTVDLEKLEPDRVMQENETQEEAVFWEGGWRYANHLVRERNRSAVQAAKESRAWICQICGIDFESLYGVRYIEAHHVEPVSTKFGKYSVVAEDFELLCPNCHKAVHIYLRSGLEHEDIRQKLKERFL